jgi:hypothetical protein
VADALGRSGRIWPEAEAVVLHLLERQYTNSIRVVHSTPPNTGRRTYPPMSPKNCVGAAIFCKRDIPFLLQDFVDRYEGRYHNIQLPLPMRLV